jgi:hypothetical protein
MTDPLRSDAIAPAWFMYVNLDPAVRLWSGAANFKLGAGSGPDTGGGLYLGLGLVVSMPVLEIPMNGEYSAHEFKLSGISALSARLINSEAAKLAGARVNIGLVPLDGQSMPIGPVQWPWIGRGDGPQVTRDGERTPPLRTLSLIASAGSPSRKHRIAANWTGPQQRAIDPNDAACDGVAALANGTDNIWPI